MNCFGTSRMTSAPLLPQGEDPRERHHCGPPQYIGKTPVDIVAQFKDEATFPWYRMHPSMRTRRFEEIYQQAQRTRNRRAVETVQLLTDKNFDHKSSKFRQEAIFLK